MTDLQEIIEKAWIDRSLLVESYYIDAIRKVINLLDDGKLRCAKPTKNG